MTARAVQNCPRAGSQEDKQRTATLTATSAEWKCRGIRPAGAIIATQSQVDRGGCASTLAAPERRRQGGLCVTRSVTTCRYLNPRVSDSMLPVSFPPLVFRRKPEVSRRAVMSPSREHPGSNGRRSSHSKDGHMPSAPRARGTSDPEAQGPKHQQKEWFGHMMARARMESSNTPTGT
jgi:hypothetical protein